MRCFTFLIIVLLFSSMFVYFNRVYSLGTYHRLVIVVRDKDDSPVSHASVRITTKWGPNDYRDVTPILSTDSSGTVEYENVYSVDAIVHIIAAKFGIELASGDHTLTYPTTHITITCLGLASLTVSAEDSGSQSLQNAQVKLNWEGGDGVPWALSKTTDSQGTTVFQQMSFQTYEVQVFWQSQLVHQDTFDFSETTRSYSAQCSIHDLTVNVFDFANKPLSQAKVTLTRSDQWKPPPKYTDGGVVVFSQLAGSEYTIQVFYGTHSNTTTIGLSRSQALSIKINFLATVTYDTTIKVVWSDDKPVASANVVIQNNEDIIFFSGITSPTGVVSVQLTEGTYTLTVSKGDLTETQTINIYEEATITVVFETTYRISTLIVEVYNQDQTFAYGAVVELYSNGQLVHDLTAVDGTATFNLPDGTYTIAAKFQDNKREETVTITQDLRLPIVFQTEMNLTLICSLIVVVMVVISAVVLIRKRKSQAL